MTSPSDLDLASLIIKANTGIARAVIGQLFDRSLPEVLSADCPPVIYQSWDRINELNEIASELQRYGLRTSFTITSRRREVPV